VIGKSDRTTREEDVVIARIVKARGIRGEVACTVETDFPERFESREKCKVVLPDGARLELRLEDHWFHKQRVILKFEGYDSMTAAESLTGGRLVVDEADAAPLPEGEYLEREVLGSEVTTVDGQRVGRVTRVMRTGGTDLLVLEGIDGRERLIPFADAICIQVDLAAKRIIVDPPDGLLDL
jgi:16S rRNA processing protein RimM